MFQLEICTEDSLKHEATACPQLKALMPHLQAAASRCPAFVRTQMMPKVAHCQHVHQTPHRQKQIKESSVMLTGCQGIEPASCTMAFANIT